MIKRLVLLFCCILLVPTIAASQSQVGSTNPGDLWVGGQIGGVFTLDRDVHFVGPGGRGRIYNLSADPGFSAGAIVGYNFCMPYRPVWERYFGVALDFQWNQFNQSILNFNDDGNQFALSLLGRLQYPLMGSERFTRGRLVPFLMFGPAIVWTDSDFGDNRTDWGVVAELGLEFFVCPTVSIGPSFRYRHVWLSTPSLHLDQFMVLGRLAYHF